MLILGKKLESQHIGGLHVIPSLLLHYPGPPLFCCNHFYGSMIFYKAHGLFRYGGAQRKETASDVYITHVLKSSLSNYFLGLVFESLFMVSTSTQPHRSTRKTRPHANIFTMEWQPNQLLDHFMWW